MLLSYQTQEFLETETYEYPALIESKLLKPPAPTFFPSRSQTIQDMETIPTCRLTAFDSSQINSIKIN